MADCTSAIAALAVESSDATFTLASSSSGTDFSAASTAALTPIPGATVTSSSSPTAAVGSLLAQHAQRERLADACASLLRSKGTALPHQLRTGLSDWLSSRNTDPAACAASLAFLDVWLAREGAFDPEIQALYDQRALLPFVAHWVVLSADDAAVIPVLHAVLSSGARIKVLLLAHAPAASSSGGGGGDAPPQRDPGLYALNYGGAFVTSVAPSAAPEQFAAAVREAAAFCPGPAVVVALTAPAEEAAGPVASGAWPLYRWHPGTEALTVDTPKLRADIAAFLDRETHLALLVSGAPPAQDAAAGAGSAASAAAAEASLSQSYRALLRGVDLPPLAILFGSDGGNAEGLAKRLGAEARGRGFTAVTVSPADAWTPAAVAGAPLVLFVVSTAGQGEFPVNARGFWKALSAMAGAGTAGAGADSAPVAAGTGATPTPSPFASTGFAVFGLGDSNYWPRKEQRVFFNKPATELDAALGALGARRLVDRGLGDDQESGGFLAGYRAWVPDLWAALGLGAPASSAAAAEAAAARVRGNEAIKSTSHLLRGTIAQGLQDTSTGALSYEDTQLTKFHGIYQQDDRDARAERKRAGLEPAYSFMVRVRIPGGSATPSQYLALDAIADAHANGTIRATTRQAIQYHGIIKGKLKPGIAAINRALMDTVAACGDVNRNVMCSMDADWAGGPVSAAVLRLSQQLSDHLTPRTGAYHEIWLDEKLVRGGPEEVEPIYGPTYLPRKFKIAIAVPPSNDVDVYAHDLGYIAVVEAGALLGYTVTVGGGMGMSHGNVKTYPRLAEPLCFCTPDQCLAIAEAVVTAQRDHGDRTNRKHARLKYTIDDRGMDWFKGEVQARLPFPLAPARPVTLANNGDVYGWGPGPAGSLKYTFFIQNGRIKDEPAPSTYRLKSGLRAIAAWHGAAAAAAAGDAPESRTLVFTPNQNLAVVGIRPADRPAFEALLAEFGIANGAHSGLRLNSMACVAMPTCGLALAESERYLPSLLDRLDAVLEESGLRDEAITIRMTGCPNGCARPYVAEIAFVGRSPGIYNLYLGAGHAGQRLNKLYRESVGEEEILAELGPLIKRFAVEREPGQHFGDWVVAAGVVKATLSGRTFHDL